LEDAKQTIHAFVIPDSSVRTAASRLPVLTIVPITESAQTATAAYVIQTGLAINVLYRLVNSYKDV
jgi:hypothetical protein